MPAAQGTTGPIQTSLYHDDSYLSSPAVASVAALAVSANLVKGTTDIADIAQDSNTFEYVVFGEPTQAQAAGPPSLGSFSFSFAVEYDNAKHAELVAASAGDAIVVVIATVTKDPIAGSTYAYLRGTIGGVSTSSPTGGVRTVTVNMAVDSTPQIFHAA